MVISTIPTSQEVDELLVDDLTHVRFAHGLELASRIKRFGPEPFRGGRRNVGEGHHKEEYRGPPICPVIMPPYGGKGAP